MRKNKTIITIDSLCPQHHKRLEQHRLTQGDTLLGYLYLCPENEWGSEAKEGEQCCEYVLDADMQGNPLADEH